MFFSGTQKEITKGAILDFIDEYSKVNEMPISNLCKIFGCSDQRK